MDSIIRPASPQSLASIHSSSTQTSTVFRAATMEDAASTHSLHTLFHDAAEQPISERPLRPRSHLLDPMEAAVAARELGAVTETTSLLARPLHPAVARRLQRQQEGGLDGAIVGTTLALFVAAETVNRSDDARPTEQIAFWTVWALSRPAIGIMEPFVRNVAVSFREAIGYWRPTLWLTRLPDKIADVLAFVVARSQSGSMTNERTLLLRFPGTPYPLECLGEVQAPDCPDLYGYQLASQYAPYLYGYFGMLCGGVLGASGGFWLARPFIKESLVPALRKVSRCGMRGAHQVSTSMVERPPRSMADLINLAIENTSRFVGRLGQSMTRRAVESTDESREVAVSHPA